MSSKLDDEVLQQRAEELARPRQEAGALRVGTHLVLPAGQERLAVRLVFVERVIPLGRSWARLPGVPSHLVGIVNVRGRLLPLTDLLPLLGLAPQQAGRGTYCVVVNVEASNVCVPRTALLCQGRPWEIDVDPGSLADPPETVPVSARRFILGVAPGLVTVLELERVLADRAILATPSGGEQTSRGGNRRC